MNCTGVTPGWTGGGGSARADSTDVCGAAGLPSIEAVGHRVVHVRGYKAEGTTPTPFDVVVRKDLDRYYLVMDVIDRVPGLGARAGYVKQRCGTSE
jgi:XFP-like protein